MELQHIDFESDEQFPTYLHIDYSSGMLTEGKQYLVIDIFSDDEVGMIFALDNEEIKQLRDFLNQLEI